jgi:hypothetical protein
MPLRRLLSPSLVVPLVARFDAATARGSLDLPSTWAECDGRRAGAGAGPRQPEYRGSGDRRARTATASAGRPCYDPDDVVLSRRVELLADHEDRRSILFAGTWAAPRTVRHS